MANAPQVEVINFPGGIGHAKAMLPRMAAAADEASQTYQIIELARKITAGVPSKDTRGELRALYIWVRDHIRYRKDPRRLELLQKPARTLEWGAGDCAAQTTLLSALAQALGHDVRYRTVGPAPNAQAHVQLQALDDRAQCWVDLDPVLEPPPASTRPRPNDLGRFGQQAPGSQRLWDRGGNMIGFAPNAQEIKLWTSPLGFVPDTQQKELWVFTPYEAGALGALVPTAGAVGCVIPAGAMRGTHVAGMHPQLRRRGVFSRLSGADATPTKVDSGEEFFFKYVAKGDPRNAAANDKWWLALNADQRQYYRYAYKAIQLYAPQGLTEPKLFKWWQSLTQQKREDLRKKAGEKIGFAKTLKKVGSVVSVVADIAAPIVSAVTGSPAPMQIKDQAKATIASVTKALTPVTKTAAALAAARGQTITKLPAPKQLPQTAAAAAFVASIIKASTPQRTVSAQLKALTGGRWSTLSGIGLTPSFHFTLGAIATPTAQQTKTARTMIDAQAAYQKKNGHPFYGKGASVLPFQKVTPGLTTDSEYGPNTRRAAAWALSTTESSLPPVHPKYAGYALTWQPPQTAAAKPAAKPATKPAAKPATKPAAPIAVKPAEKPAQPTAATAWNQTPALKKLAGAAVDSVRAFIKKNGKPPQVKLAPVLAYQAAYKKAAIAAAPAANKAAVTALLKNATDGLWGPNTQDACANTLNVALSTMPPYAAAYAKKSTATPVKPVEVKKEKATPVNDDFAEAKKRAAAAETAAAKKKAAEAKKKKKAGSKDAPVVVDNVPDNAVKVKDGGLVDPWGNETSGDLVDPWAGGAAADGGEKKDNTIAWLAFGYWYTRRRRAA